MIGDVNYESAGRLRTSIGRTYYATFLSVMKRLEEQGTSFNETNRIHEQVITRANERNSFIGGQLDLLRGYRVDADYHMDSRIDPDLAKKCVKIAQSVLRSLKLLS